MFQPVIYLLQAYNILFEPLLNRLKERIRIKVFSRGQIILREGEVCPYIFFISKGIFRSYIIREGKQINVWYMMEKDMAAAADSFYYRQPSRENIVAMQKTEAFCISFEDLQAISLEFPAFQAMVLDLLWKYHIMFYERVIDFLHLTPEERYQYLLEKQPELLQRVPRKYLTSYLGMSVSTLRRVTKKGRKY